MMIKLAIAGVALLAAGVLFSGELASLFPSSAESLPSSLGEDVSRMRESALHALDARISGGISDAGAKLGRFTESSAAYVSDGIAEGVSRAGQSEILAGARP